MKMIRKRQEASIMNKGGPTGRKKTWLHSKGVTYFDRKTERLFFFIFTIIMLLWGFLVKAGLLPG